jgi:DNA-binding IclR family transcriptional regulator
VLDERGSALGALTIPYIQYNGSLKKVDHVLKALRKAAGEVTAAIGGKLHP